MMTKQEKLYHYVLDDLLSKTSVERKMVIVPIFVGTYFHDFHEEFIEEQFRGQNVGMLQTQLLKSVREKVTFLESSKVSIRYFLQSKPKMSKDFFDYLYYHGLREESNELWVDYVKGVRKKISKKSFYWWISIGTMKLTNGVKKFFTSLVPVLVKFVSVVFNIK